MIWFALPGLDWSQPLPIRGDWPEGLTLGPGVYRLIVLNETIRRVCGDDDSGTLYVGQAGALEGRINELRKALRPEDYRSGAHGAGRLFRATEVLSARFATETLATTWALVATEPWRHENDLIHSYLGVFGEAPPLNRQRSIPNHD